MGAAASIRFNDHAHENYSSESSSLKSRANPARIVIDIDDIDGTSIVAELVRNSNWKALSTILDENAAWAGNVISKKERALPIHVALLKSAPMDFVQRLLRLSPECTSKADREGRIALHYAVMQPQCSVALAQLLIDAHPDGIEKKTAPGKLPIHFAAEYNSTNAPLIRLLLDRYAVGARDYCEGMTPIHLACENKCSLEVFDIIRSYHEPAVREKGRDGMSPLHVAVYNRAPLAVIAQLIELHPFSLTDRDRQGRVPLHYGLERKVADDALLLLLKAASNSAAIRGFGGCFPLHTAVEKHATFPIIRALLDYFPEAAKEVDMFGSLPLQVALRNTQAAHNSGNSSSRHADDATIDALLATFPDAVKACDEFKRIGLHYTVSRRMPASFVRRLLDVYPQGAAAVDIDGQLPLHLAFKRNAEALTISMLIEAYPDGVVCQDKFNMMPINYGIEQGMAVEKLLLLIRQKGQERGLSIRSQDKLPLHHAIEFKRPLEVIQAIGDAYPNAAQDREHAKGRLPLCWAMERKADIKVVLYLFSLFGAPSALLEDYAGLLPIHYATKYHADVAIVRLLLESHPQIARTRTHPIHNSSNNPGATVRTKAPSMLGNNSDDFNPIVEASFESKSGQNTDNSSNDGNMPTNYRNDDYSQQSNYGKRRRQLNGRMLLHYAIEDMEAPYPTVAEILALTMPLDRLTERPYPDHFYTWTFVLAESHDRYADAVHMVLQRYDHSPYMIRYLSHFPDEQGHKSIDIATPKCKQQLLMRLYFFGRYDIQPGPYLHKSLNSLVRLAVDHGEIGESGSGNTSNGGGDEKQMVALKFMSNRLQFDREVNLRSNMGVSANRFVVPIIKFHDSDGDLLYRLETQRKGFGEYPYCIVMLAADRDLQSIILHEHFVGGRDWSTIKAYGSQILEGLNFLHGRGIVHCDVKPLNLLRQDSRLKVIDLGAAVNYVKQERAKVQRTSQSYLPPELVEILLKTNEHSNLSEASGQSPQQQQPLNLDVVNPTWTSIAVPAAMSHFMSCERRRMTSDSDTSVAGHPSIDMWSFGVILYWLCTGEPLFSCDVDDNMGDHRYLKLLAEWPDRFKAHKLAKVSDLQARSLLNQLLSKQPHRRPSADKCLTHPFFSQINLPSRVPGQIPQYDIYVAHRIRDAGCKWPAYLAQSHSPSQHGSTASSVYSSVANAEIVTVAAGASAITDEAAYEGHVGYGQVLLSRFEDLLAAYEEKLDENLENNNTEANVDGCYLMEEFVRCVDDDAHVKFLRQRLSKKGLAVTTSSDGVASEKALDAVIEAEALHRNAVRMINSRSVVFLLSRYAVNNYLDGSTFEQLSENDIVPPLLWEMRLALELQAMGLLEGGVSVVLVGDVVGLNELFDDIGNLLPQRFITAQSDQLFSLEKDKVDTEGDSGIGGAESAHEYGMYFAEHEGDPVGRFGSCHPKQASVSVVRTVEDLLANCLEAQSLGAPVHNEGVSVRELLGEIIAHSSFMVHGRGHTAWDNVADDVAAWSRNQQLQHNPLRPISAEFGSSTSVGVSASAQLWPPSPSSPPRSPNMLPASRGGPLSAGAGGLATPLREQEQQLKERLFERADADLAEISLLQGESTALTFLQGKLANRSIEVENLRIEMALLQRQLDLKTQDLNRLRHRFNVTE